MLVDFFSSRLNIQLEKIVIMKRYQTPHTIALECKCEYEFDINTIRVSEVHEVDICDECRCRVSPIRYVDPMEEDMDMLVSVVSTS